MKDPAVTNQNGIVFFWNGSLHTRPDWLVMFVHEYKPARSKRIAKTVRVINAALRTHGVAAIEASYALGGPAAVLSLIAAHTRQEQTRKT